MNPWQDPDSCAFVDAQFNLEENSKTKNKKEQTNQTNKKLPKKVKEYHVIHTKQSPIQPQHYTSS